MAYVGDREVVKIGHVWVFEDTMQKIPGGSTVTANPGDPINNSGNHSGIPDGFDIGNYPISNIPTSGVFCVVLDITSWSWIKKNPGKLKYFDFPKKHA